MQSRNTTTAPASQSPNGWKNINKEKHRTQWQIN
jgi:hypothetical protein